MFGEAWWLVGLGFSVVAGLWISDEIKAKKRKKNLDKGELIDLSGLCSKANVFSLRGWIFLGSAVFSIAFYYGCYKLVTIF